MAENLTRQTDQSVAAFLAAIDDPARRRDSEALVALLRQTSRSSKTSSGSARHRCGPPVPMPEPAPDEEATASRGGDAVAFGGDTRRTVEGLGAAAGASVHRLHGSFAEIQ
jgi:hypothetical protein